MKKSVCGLMASTYLTLDYHVKYQITMYIAQQKKMEADNE